MLVDWTQENGRNWALSLLLLFKCTQKGTLTVRDQNSWFIPLSKTTGIHDLFHKVTPPPGDQTCFEPLCLRMKPVCEWNRLSKEVQIVTLLPKTEWNLCQYEIWLHLIKEFSCVLWNQLWPEVKLKSCKTAYMNNQKVLAENGNCARKAVSVKCRLQTRGKKQ